jgi:hypothetical protein
VNRTDQILGWVRVVDTQDATDIRDEIHLIRDFDDCYVGADPVLASTRLNTLRWTNAIAVCSLRLRIDRAG